MKTFSFMTTRTLLLVAMMAGGAILFSSCNGNTSSGEKLPYPLQVKAYYDKDTMSPDNQSEPSVAYFDLSDGIIVAYKTNADCSNFLHQITQKITSGESEVYGLANDEITSLEMKQTALYNKIMDASSYRQAMAPIEKTLEKIVTDGKNALLVTDFEEYTPDKRVQHAAFATKYFSSWLKDKGDITFFVFDYVEKRMPKHLYFIVFDTKEHQLLTKVREATTGIGGYEEFHLTRNAFNISNNYSSTTTGGTYHSADRHEDIVTAVLEDGSPEAYTRYGEGSLVEYYPLGESWKNILKNAQDMSLPGNKPLFTALFRNLFIDLSNQDSYLISRLEAKVTDVENDFTLFEENRLAQTASDKENDYHYDIDGNLLEEFNYSPQPIAEIKDMLVIDQAIFDQSLKENQGKKAELALNFSPNFVGQPIGGNENDLFRVDICIAECEPNLSARLDELFSWGDNSNLRDAIKNTLQEVNPRGTIVYTYFLKEM